MSISVCCSFNEISIKLIVNNIATIIEYIVLFNISVCS